MATERQYQIPGGGFINETTNQSEYQIPGGSYVNETTAAAVELYTVNPVDYLHILDPNCTETLAF